MLSEDEVESASNTQPQEPHSKRRRLHGACDTCRRKKIKCNSAEMPNKICSNCIAYSLECTHNIPRHASKKETEKGYIQALEERLDKMEQLLRNVHPEIDIEQSVASTNSPESIQSAPTPPNVGYSRNTPVADFPYPTPQTLPDTAAYHASPPTLNQNNSDEEDLAHISLAQKLSKLSVDTIEDRFFGKSSAFMLMQHATDVKQELTGVELPTGRALRRPFFWELRNWEIDHINSDLPQFEFPEKDLFDHLVGLYFDRLNIYVPLLHRPTFERDLANDLHLHDVGFAQVVLIVCALASRYSDDPRVILPGDKTGLSSGFKYFRQARLMRNRLLDKASLYDLQFYCLVIPYLLASSLPQAGWSLVALALRLAQERGAHRRGGENYKNSVVNELWKRCFWALISYDRLTSSFVGRSCAMTDEDFDADFPVECDDEYWDCEDPTQNWKQPPGKPSKVTAFNAFLRLCEILAFTLRTLYSTKKSKILTGLIGDQWEQRVVAELDSSMNRWKDSLPDHLRWDPSRPVSTFLHQTAYIHATYYYIQIQIHRPFIQKTTSLSFPSLAICTNTARACSHLVDAKGAGWIYPSPNLFIASFASGIVLLLHMYGGRRAGLKTDLEKEVKNVQRCMEALRAMEKKWHVAGRLNDILTELSTVQEGQVLAPKFISTKRQREDQPQQQQPIDPPSPIQYRFQKPRPTRQPKGWPPISSTPGAIPPSTPKLESDRRKSTGSFLGQNQPSIFASQAPQTPQTPLNLNIDSDPHLRTTSTASYSVPLDLATATGIGWDLNQLVLAQMNFNPAPQVLASTMFQGQEFTTSQFGGTPATLGDRTQLPSNFPSQNFTSSLSSFTEQNQLVDASQDMTALWSDAPSDFNIEEWDQFVASIHDSGGPWTGVGTDFNVNAQ